MVNDDVIAVGDRIDLTTERDEPYKTIVGDITGDGSLLVVTPSHRGVGISVGLGDDFRLYFYRQSGRYGMNVKVGGFLRSNSVRLIRLIPMSEPQKEQRREFYRLPASLRTLVCRDIDVMSVPQDEEGSADEIAYTNDISVTGVSLRMRRAHFVGERILLKVYLNWPNENAPPIDIYSEVRRVNTVLETGGYQAGILFLRLSRDDNELIRKFVLTQQLKR